MKKVILINLLLLGLLLIIVEFSCSVAFYLKDEKNPLILSESVIDFPYAYYTFIPEKKNGKMIVNDDGLYTCYGRKKTAGTTRIMLLGGSTARGMLSDATVSDCLESMLKKEFPDRKIEVVNAGMSGYVVEQLFIYYQLVLSKYDPDIVAGLNGYNDLMSVKLNRQGEGYFAPQNMAQFRVIQDGKSSKTFSGRLAAVFPSTFRAADFLKRQILKKSRYDYSMLSDAKIKEASGVYLGIINDIRSFCGSKGIAYLEFLQPVRWYVSADLDENIKRHGEPQLIKLYAAYEKGITGLDYGCSLASLSVLAPDTFKDDCHLSREGIEAIAQEMFSRIKKELVRLWRLRQ